LVGVQSRIRRDSFRAVHLSRRGPWVIEPLQRRHWHRSGPRYENLTSGSFHTALPDGENLGDDRGGGTDAPPARSSVSHDDRPEVRAYGGRALPLAIEEADMCRGHLALTLHFAAGGQGSLGGSILFTVLRAVAAIELTVTLILVWRVLRSGSGGANDGGRGDGDDSNGPGWGRRRRPRTPPPDGPAWWSEFEHQFAEHVQARATRQPASTRSRDEPRTSGRDGVRRTRSSESST
jgi:hypothetical protein